MTRLLKNFLKGLLIRGFHLGQRLGFDVLPRHFYSEIPDVRRLRRTTSWRQPFSMFAVRGAEIAGQAEFARSTLAPVAGLMKTDEIHRTACERNGEQGYGPVEAAFLFAFVASRKPPTIFQVGSGVSTAVCIAAAKQAGYLPEIVCVDPFPTDFLRAAAAAGEIRLIDRPVEDLQANVIQALSPGSLFFVDSTHTLGPAGEVSRLILEFLPRLPAGVTAHFHDIYFPYDYTRDVLDKDLFYPHESALLLAFLACNPRFRILASLAMLHYAEPGAIKDCVPYYSPAASDFGLAAGAGHFPSAIYIEVGQ